MNIKVLLIKSGIGLAGLGSLGFAIHQGYQAINSKSKKKTILKISLKMKDTKN